MMAYCECSQPLFDCRSDEGACRPGVVRCLQPCWYVNLPEVDNRPLFDCWSDDESGLACRRSGARGPQLYLNENGSDSSLQSCNSDHALKQWTTAAPCCHPLCYPSAPPCQRRSKRRSKSAGDDDKNSSVLIDTFDINDVNHNRCTTTRKRRANRSQDAANCLLSDASDADDFDLDAARDDEDLDVDVNNNRPAKVDLTSCNSSFSDCSLPCHQLITCSSPSQLAKGRVKMSIRPPAVAGKSGKGRCFDDDCLNIKFVGNFVDFPDEKIEDERQLITRGSLKRGSFVSQSAGGTPIDAENDNGSSALVTGQPADSENVNISSRPTRRQWSNSTSEKSRYSTNTRRQWSNPTSERSGSSKNTRRHWSNPTSEKSVSSNNTRKHWSNRTSERSGSSKNTRRQSSNSNPASEKSVSSNNTNTRRHWSNPTSERSGSSNNTRRQWSNPTSERSGSSKNTRRQWSNPTSERSGSSKNTRRQWSNSTSEKSGSSKNRNKSSRPVKRQWLTAATSEPGYSRNRSFRRAYKQSSASTGEQSEIFKTQSLRSVRAARSGSSAASENMELESAYDDTDDTWRKTTLSRGMSRTPPKHRTSKVYFDEEDSRQYTKSPTTNRIIKTNVDGEQSDEQNEQEILFLYGKIREIIRGPDVNAPDDVIFLANVAKTDAEINKETLSPLTVVKEPPTIENSIDDNNSSKEPGTRATSQTQVDDGMSASNAPPRSRTPSRTLSRRSEAAERAGKAACLRAANIVPHQTQSDVDGSNRSLTTDATHRTLSFSAPEVPELSDSMNNLTEMSSMTDLVVAKRSTTQYSRGSSPWITADSQDYLTPETANSTSDVSRSTAPHRQSYSRGSSVRFAGDNRDSRTPETANSASDVIRGTAPSLQSYSRGSSLRIAGDNQYSPTPETTNSMSDVSRATAPRLQSYSRGSTPRITADSQYSLIAETANSVSDVSRATAPRLQSYSRGSSPWITADSQDYLTPETANSVSDVSRATAPRQLSYSRGSSLRFTGDIQYSPTPETANSASDVSRSTTPRQLSYIRGFSGDSQDSRTPEAANSASDISRSTTPPRLLSLHNQHQVNSPRPTRSGKDFTSVLSRLPRPIYRMSPADPSDQDTADWSDQSSPYIGYVSAQPRQSSPVQSSLVSSALSSSPPSQLASCLKCKYSSQSPLSSKSSMPSNSTTPQRRRRIRFASEVKQRN